MDRAQKRETVAALKQTFNETSVVVVTRNLGLSVAQSTNLRNRMRDAGASLQGHQEHAHPDRARRHALCADERHADRADRARHLDRSGRGGQGAVDFAKTNDRLEIVGGAMGDTLLDVDGVKALAELPSLDELRARIIGLVQAPAAKIARTINEPGAQLARIFGAYAAKEARDLFRLTSTEPLGREARNERTGDLTWQTSIPSSISSAS
jgi:large subunit ribosomal protein L10